MFQVSIADLAKLTQLDFGPLGEADAHEATSAGPRLIESYEEIKLG
jgi:endonuclease G, mitochondrial